MTPKYFITALSETVLGMQFTSLLPDPQACAIDNQGQIPSYDNRYRPSAERPADYDNNKAIQRQWEAIGEGLNSFRLVPCPAGVISSWLAQGA